MAQVHTSNVFEPLTEWLHSMLPAAGTVLWHRDHAEVPVIFITLYLAFIFGVPNLMERRNPLPLKALFAVWCLALSVFSFIGAFNLLPYLYASVMDKGVKYTICETTENWYAPLPVGVYVTIFIYSKIPELLDTVFLVLRKKQVIFLHWFHHVTVLMYCWHAYHNTMPCGIWFACMNYSVHAIMYFYYFCTNVGLYHIVSKIAIIITIIQILQMIGGIAVLVTVKYYNDLEGSEGCYADKANVKLGLLMYFSYFVLFVLLFVDKYYWQKATAKQAKQGCFDDAKNLDASGFFHKNAPAKSAAEKKRD